MESVQHQRQYRCELFSESLSQNPFLLRKVLLFIDLLLKFFMVI